MPNCNSCNAEIIWATWESTGKPHPIDAAPVAAGTIAIFAGRARSYSDEDKRLHRERYTSHFATCPQRASWRGRPR
jgi:hypothetical protein